MMSVTKKPAYHHNCSVPEVVLAFPKQVANAVSKRPAIMSMIQFILLMVFYCKEATIILI